MPVPVEGFDHLVEPFRTELLAYCYRMLGSAHDAEDLVQDTYLRAWRAREQYDETRSSLRTWLYRIATNACLTALQARGRRPLPSGLVAASDPLGPLVRGEVAWLQPLPDAMLDAGDPARTVIGRSSLRLAFVSALQHLSARQRGALILRDVLSFSASEAADILGTTVVSVNSSLQRARARLRESGVRPERLSEPPAAEQRAWVDRYMNAFEQADVEGLKRLLTEDVLMEMPPMLNWFAGPASYGVFMDWVFAHAGTARLRRLPAGRRPVRAAHAPGPHRDRRGHQPELGVPGTRGLRGLRPRGQPRRLGSRRRAFSRGRDEFRARRRYVPTSSPEPPGGPVTRENLMSDSRADDRAAIQAVLAGSYQAWEAGDAGGMVASYTADATAIMTGSLRDSRAVIRDSMARAFEGPLKGSSTYNKQLSLRFVGRDAAIVVSESGILLAGQAEVPDAGKVNATWVLEKRDGQWLIAAYHNSPALAPGH